MCTNILLKIIVCNLCVWNIEIIFHSVVRNILYEIMKNARIIMYAKYFIFLNIVQNVKAKPFSLHAWYDSSRYHSIWTISFCYNFFLYTYIGLSLMKACYNIQRCQLPIPTISLVTKVLFTPSKHTYSSGKYTGM